MSLRITQQRPTVILVAILVIGVLLGILLSVQLTEPSTPVEGGIVTTLQTRLPIQGSNVRVQ